MARSRFKSKGRHDSKPFLRLPREIVDSQQYAKLTSHAIKLLIDLFAQYRGNNNGDFTAAWSVMIKRGWRSRDTLAKSLKLLLELGFIQKTRQGGRHKTTLFAVTWLTIDECNGKLDVSSTKIPFNLWKQ